MNRRNLLKSALGVATLGGLSALKPLYANSDMVFKAKPMFILPQKSR